MKKRLGHIIPRFGIQGKLNFLFILLSTIPLSLISIYFIQEQIRYREENTLHTVKTEVHDIKTKTTLLLTRVKQEMNILSKTTEVKRLIQSQSMKGKAKSEQLEIGYDFISLLKDNELYFRVELLDKVGRKMLSAYFNDGNYEIIPKDSLPKKPMYFYVNAVKDMVKGEVNLSPTEIRIPSSGKILPSIDCLIPIFDENNKLSAILTASIKAELFFKNFAINRLDTNVKVIMVNGEGFYLYHSQNKKDWNRLLASRQEQNLYTDYSKSVSDSILNGVNGTITEDPDRIIEYASIFSGNESKTTHYIIFTEIPTSIAYASVIQLRWIFVGIFIIVIGLSVLAGYVTSRNYIRPVNQLIHGTRIIRDGDLDYVLKVDSSDEIQDLVESFNLLVVHWKDKRELEERQRNEVDIRERKKYLDTIMDSSLDLLITIRENGKLSFANNRLEDELGYKFEDIKDKDFIDLIPKHLHPELENKWLQAQNISGIVYETQLIKADGSVIDCLVSHSQLKGLNEYLAIIKDITERKRNEELLRASEIRYRRLFEAAKDGIIILDASTCLVEDINPSLTDMLGFSIDDLMGKKLVDFKIFENISLDFQKSGKLKNYIKYEELPVENFNGEQIFIEFVASNYNVNNRNVIQCNIRNVTERKLAEDAIILAKERAEIANRLKSNFLANMSHELRTPMIGIQGFSKILKESNDINDSREIGGYIAESSNRLMDTLNLIIDISRIESGDWQVNLTPIDLIHEIYDVMNKYNDFAIEKNLYLILNSEFESFELNSDQNAISSILNNLIDNAIKFTSVGGVEIKCRMEIFNQKKFAVIDIIDTGIGIAEDKIEIIFEEFRQISEGLVRDYDGTGLGLTLTKKLVYLLGGNIVVKSSLGNGSDFTVSLPVT